MKAWSGWGLTTLLACTPGACTHSTPPGSVPDSGSDKPVVQHPPEPPGDEPPSEPIVIHCRSAGHLISPLIYGVGWSAGRSSQDFPWDLNPGARRWGGNGSTRYNWQLGVTNTGDDWFYRNIDATDDEQRAWTRFVDENVARQVPGSLTVPMIGWVARDNSAVGFPVSRFGPQQSVAPELPEAGNGYTMTGAPIVPAPPDLTSVPATPEFVGQWVRSIRDHQLAKGARGVDTYVLDNEPTLWHETHRDVHPDPVSYDELLDRTIQFASKVRAEDPEALIAGPSLWGWYAWQYSGVDKMAGSSSRPDRRAHGDVPLLAWYLRKLQEHEATTGVRLLDIVDVHFYPAADGVGYQEAGGIDPATAALRIRSTRALWDPEYLDESWIEERLQILPSLKALIEENYPGRKISIGEYNFGAEQHVSGGLAVAEALGRFAQADIHSAYYWSQPTRGSAAYWGFRAFRNFDGTGGRFQDQWVPAGAPEGVSVFASRDPAGTRMVVIALNLQPDRAQRIRLELDGCGTPVNTRAFSWAGQAEGFAPAALQGKASSLDLPGWSIGIYDLEVR